MARVAKTTTQTTGTKNAKKELGMETVIICQRNAIEQKAIKEAKEIRKKAINKTKKIQQKGINCAKEYVKRKRIKKAINTILFAIVGSVLVYAAIEKYNEPKDIHTIVGYVTENSMEVETVDCHRYGYDTQYPDGTPVIVEIDRKFTETKKDDVVLNVW